jgi:hypothetical protein
MPDASAARASAGSVVEGCLGGTSPNFTVTDKSGAKYSILVPQGADASPLQKHIGESVAVEGSIDDGTSASSSAGSAGSAAAGQSAAAGGKAIHATRIGRGTGQCPASGGAGSSTTTPKPPSK